MRAEAAALARADARLAADDLAGAIAVLEDAVRTVPHPGLLARLGDLRFRHGRLDAAIEALEAALAAEPMLVPARVALAHCRAARGADDPNLAAIQALLARADLPREHRVALGHAAAKLLDDLGEHAAAWARAAEARAARAPSLRPYDAAADRALRERAAARLALALPAPEGARASERPVLVVGMPRSGTTLVARVIGAHPAAAEVGERRFLAEADAALAALPGPDAAAALPAQAERCLARLEAAAGAPAERIATKLPSDYRRVGTFMALFPRARVVVCRRHPLDVGLSTFLQHFAEGDRSTVEPEAFAECWAEHERWLALWRGVYAASMTDVEYEALVSDHPRQARRLIEALGLGWDERVLDHAARDGAIRTASAGQVTQPVHARSVARWRRYARELEPLRRALLARGVEVPE